MIEIKNLSISYQEKIVLHHFSAQMKEGSTIAIMGNSGIGKSTLLKIIMGIEKPDEGEILGLSEKRISAVFQEDRLCEELSAVKNVMLVLEGQKKRELAMMHLLELMNKEDLTKKVLKLSGGMKRRVSVARAFAYPSDLIILDEPLTGLDSTNKKRTIDYMLKYKNHRTMIVVTHDINEVEALQASQVIQLV